MQPEEPSNDAKKIKQYEGHILALESIVQYLLITNPSVTIDESEIWELICVLDHDEEHRNTARKILSAHASAALTMKTKKPHNDG